MLQPRSADIGVDPPQVIFRHAKLNVRSRNAATQRRYARLLSGLTPGHKLVSVADGNVVGIKFRIFPR